MVPWVERPTITINLAAPAAERLRHVPPHVVNEGRRLLLGILEQFHNALRPLAHEVRARTADRFQSEIEAAAALIGVDWEDVVLANVSYDLVIASLGCSTAAIATASGPVMARNLDWWPEDLLAQSCYAIHHERNGALAFVNVGWLGGVGVVTGLSRAGFALALNAVWSPEGADRAGYPVLLHLRRTLEDASDFGEALERLKSERLMTAGLFTLIGVKNDERVVIERTPTRHALRWPRGDEPLVATNDYRSLETRGFISSILIETTCGRFDALGRLLRRCSPSADPTDHELLVALSHPEVIQMITAQHVILRPSAREVRLYIPRRLAAPPERFGDFD